MCEIRNRRGLESLPLSKVLTDPSAVQRLTASNFKSTGVAAEMVAERFRIGIKVEGIPVAFEPFEPHSPSKLTHCFACGSTDASSKPTYRRIAVPSMEEAERLIGLLGEGATLQTNKDPHDQSDWPFHVRIEECDDHLDTRGPYPHIRTLEGFGWTYGALNRQLVEAAQQPT